MYKSKKGRLYVYHRPSGERVWTEPGTWAFKLELDWLDQKATTAVRRDLTFGDMCRAYLQSHEFTSFLAERTRLEYRRILLKIESLYNVPISTFDRAFILELRSQMFLRLKVRTTNDVLRVLSTIFSWGVPRGFVKANMIKQVPRLKRGKGPAQSAPKNRRFVVNLMHPSSNPGLPARSSGEKMLSLLDEENE